MTLDKKYKWLVGKISAYVVQLPSYNSLYYTKLQNADSSLLHSVPQAFTAL